jgi:hypothetical protein
MHFTWRIRLGILVILCTGFSEQIDEKKAKEMGISAFIDETYRNA